MKRQARISLLSILLILLIAAAAVLTGCTEPTPPPPTGDQEGMAYGAEIAAEREIGAGAVTFRFTVVNGENKATVYTIRTDAADLRTALTENGLIPAGSKGDLVNTVDGITADWSADQGWWMLAANGSLEMISYGVDDAKIEEGADYAFIYKKGF